ncbi:hypothetical protein COV88_03955 [Candidatus Saccharibacteria bacterium CG11_big_fil_rev_8_21_14_0_20_41_19]|nr:hypothetical protein [Candidatus Saccharibacteria bacterium]OIP85701.1 MAG: hypothetical protein AUK57_02465 [Candidatus Saccharibacteria bacterium CG2_30_41_52]PIQ70572.1 MAG: hypothetical protein COV88_03955 [Candidatus Saccharibacteria bacterium CG11_big_fil_rev_8_21_14_0_20_41_19]PIZ59481.1 MAG: hypothetical protein COY18_03175 [Candidatus Saccharibacteria bacterium CG_4_10_14_0_2_um_filter_41_11]PJC29365.1 MAG: hypothetical protein CO052_03785 [Candidatus Saccharibacteria bacterium CG_4
MKPETPLTSFSPEQQPAPRGLNIDRDTTVSAPENGVENGAERYEQIAEASAVIADVNLTTTLPTPVTNNDSVVNTTTSSSNPPVARNEDLIEREWVDKAKKIVSETRNDPYRREEAVNKLQVDYLKKRYGRELDVAG